MTTVAPLRRNHDASGTQAFRVGSMTTVTSESAGNDCHSFSSSSELRPKPSPAPEEHPFVVSQAGLVGRPARDIDSQRQLLHSFLLVV